MFFFSLQEDKEDLDFLLDLAREVPQIEAWLNRAVFRIFYQRWLLCS